MKILNKINPNRALLLIGGISLIAIIFLGQDVIIQYYQASSNWYFNCIGGCEEVERSKYGE